MRVTSQLFAAMVLSTGALMPNIAPGYAADLGRASTTEVHQADTLEVRGYLERKADLLLIRAVFDLVDREEILEALGRDELRLAGQVGESELSDLLDTLLFESAYLLVSLQYLIEAGGAYFPDDRPYDDYANDALVHLNDLRRELTEVISKGDDPIGVLKQANELLGLTEGHAELPESLAYFDERDALVSEVLGD